MVASLLLLLGFSVVSSLGATLSENRWWMLACGLLCCVALPALLASWIRSLRRTPGRPGTVGVIAVTNLLLVLGPALLLPGTTAARLGRDGAWWVESIARLAGGSEQSIVVRGAGRTFRWLAGLLPAEAHDGPTTVSAPSDGRPSGTDGGPVEPAPDVSAPTPQPDLSLAPARPGQVQVRFERRGSAVVIPVVLHGPSGDLSVKMLLDTGATLTTLNEATLRRLGLFVSTSDPTIETHTANGTVRRAITVIDGVTLGVARLAGGKTVAVCDPCARGDVVGLLGLNVLQQFKVTLDDEAGVLLLRPHRSGNPKGDLADIQPFIQFTGATGTWSGPMLTVTATLHNSSPRALRHVKIVAQMHQGTEVGKVWGELRDVPAHGSAAVRLQGLSAVKSSSFQLLLERADW